MFNKNEINLISDDTNYLTNEDIFILKRGKNYKIDQILKEAKSKNPKLIISNYHHKDIYYVKNINKYEKKIIKEYNVNPTIIGVTGTNGKTSTTTIIYSVLKKLNKKVMLIGSNGIYFNDFKLPTRNTTPSKLTILYLINKYLDNNSYLIIELSSQSYSRIKSLHIDYLIFTNLSKEHLDTHKTMKRYFKAKIKIINLLKNKENLFINIDDNYGKKLLKKYKIAQTYSIKDINIISNNPIKFIFNNYKVTSKLSGNFNIYNILSSILVVNKIFTNLESIIESIKDIDVIEGRNNVYNYKNNKIIIDYAHTPYSFENIISHYYHLKFNSIYILFGFGGNKDISKRSEMIQVSLKYSNNIILTEDNSRDEKFINIIKSALKDEYDNLIIIQDRKEAIRYAISKLSDNDCLLILGKGNENYMLKNKEFIEYSDYGEVKKWLI